MRKSALALLAILGAAAGWFALTAPGNRGRRRRPLGHARARGSLGDLQRAILGASRGAVAAVFGPPRAMVSPSPQAQMKDYWHADTWYYPLDPARRTGVAIRFRDDTAEAVDFIAGPGAA